VAQLGVRLDGIEEVVGSNPIGSTNRNNIFYPLLIIFSLSRASLYFKIWRWAFPQTATGRD
jgi:hypothetical protein